MKAFKTFIASAIAGVMVLSMATSAFAMTVDSVNTNSVVSVSGASDVAGERTVLVVDKAAWNDGVLSDNANIVYINQVNNLELANTLATMAGKDLIHGDYVVLVGNENGTVDSQTFTAIKVVANAPGVAVGGETPVSWEVSVNNSLLAADTLVAKFYDKTEGYLEGTEKTLWWDEGALEVTGSGVFTFTAETTVSDNYAGNTGLEISAGTVSGRN